MLIRAMSLVKADVDLVVIGPGNKRPYTELAERLGIKHRVHFLGFVDEETKIGAIDASLAIVIPSVSDYVEVYPMAITEAWAREKPVIATMVGGIPYRVKQMINGLLVPPRNPRALAEAITLLTNNKELGRKLGTEGRKNIHTWDEIVNKLIKIYTAK